MTEINILRKRMKKKALPLCKEILKLNLKGKYLGLFNRRNRSIKINMRVIILPKAQYLQVLM